MKDLIYTLIETLGVSREEAMQLASVLNVSDDEDQWADEYETF